MARFIRRARQESFSELWILHLSRMLGVELYMMHLVDVAIL